MSEYKSDKKRVGAPASVIFSKLSNLENLRSFIDNLPEDRIPADKLEAIKQMEVTPDSLTVQGGPTGQITLNIVKRVPDSLIVLQPANLPLSLNLEIRIEAHSENESEIQVAIEADLPMMLRPMVKGPFNQMVTQFADMLAAIPYDTTSSSGIVDSVDE